jgi:peptidoglycan hydrolase-like protein with peptidoglycan-binding domain
VLPGNSIRKEFFIRRYPGTSSGSYYSAAQITAIAELLQFALLVNGHSAGAIDGEYGDATRQALYDFQEDMKITPTGYADKTTWLSLFISCGDTSRSALAADCATQLTAAKAKTIYDNGYRYIGRYLTGNNKKITRSEAQIIFDAGLKFFPIYQSSANYLEYFTPQQGADDAQKAKKAATELGLPENTIIYFAVDFDCLDYQITNNVIPYFERVHSEMADSGYRVGIYGTRNACMRVSNLGYAYSSFVGDMSTGFSGNLGFKMPSNWAFDQFVTTTIGSGNGEIEIDKDGYSGYDPAVSRLNDISSAPSPENLFAGNSANDEVVGPTVDILGYQIPLFKLNVGLEVKDIVKMEVEFDQQENAYKVLIGVTKESLSTEITGGSTRSGKFKEYYREAKTTLSLIGKIIKNFRDISRILKVVCIKRAQK